MPAKKARKRAAMEAEESNRMAAFDEMCRVNQG